MLDASTHHRGAFANPGPGSAVGPDAAVLQAGLSVERPQPVDLGGLTAVRREPVRPISERGPDFDAEFDDSTLVFDAFWADAGDRIVMIAPALLNLRRLFTDATPTALPSGAACKLRIRSLDRQDRITVEAPRGTRELLVETEAACFRVTIGENRSDLFAGRRVLLTLQKDNPIAWVLDWVRYHRDQHGADAVLLYDNNSAAYSPEELATALAALEGIAAVRVISWPFKYGPQAFPGGDWDSDYCQLGALEHARWRYLTRARSVLNSDIDELVLSEAGQKIFAAAETTRTGLLRYDGVWIMGVAGRNPPAGPGTRHRDYGIRLRPRMRWSLRGRVDGLTCFAKWTVVPARCPEGAQWCVHRIDGWLISHFKTGRFEFRHFRQINTQWKYDRTVLEPFDPARHAHDAALAAACAQVRWSA